MVSLHTVLESQALSRTANSAKWCVLSLLWAISPNVLLFATIVLPIGAKYISYIAQGSRYVHFVHHTSALLAYYYIAVSNRKRIDLVLENMLPDIDQIWHIYAHTCKLAAGMSLMNCTVVYS